MRFAGAQFTHIATQSKPHLQLTRHMRVGLTPSCGCHYFCTGELPRSMRKGAEGALNTVRVNPLPRPLSSLCHYKKRFLSAFIV